MNPESSQNMNDTWKQEVEKWESYYASLDLRIESDETRSFGDEILEKLEGFLPAGAGVLEAGCGGGWQSLSLARSGKYKLSLLDFSQEALKYARRVFERSGLKADLIYENMAMPGRPDFDLVFNAGVLEHYTFEEQVELVHGMASRSKKYVMVIVPNRLCYWYWIWRLNAANQERWVYGKEVPFVDFSRLFAAAGMQYLGQSFMASDWTNSFIELIPGIDDRLKRLILEAHQNPLIDEYQKSYLVAGLGSVSGETGLQVPGWSRSPVQEDFENAELRAMFAEMLAKRLRDESQAKEQIERLAAQLDQTHATAELYHYQLEEIQNGPTWAMSLRLVTLRQKFIPIGSRRSALARKVYDRSKALVRLMRIASLRKAVRRITSGAAGRKPRLKAVPVDKEFGFLASYQNKKAAYIHWLTDTHNANPPDLELINQIIHQKPYKGIVVYPHAVHWEPIQRPHQLLIEFGRQGYLCFFCESEEPQMGLEEISENVYIIHGEKYLLYPFQNVHVLVLCTWMYQLPFIDALPNRCLWYDLIDKIEIFSLYDQDMENMHEQVVRQADLVTYSGLKLKEFVAERKDALYLPNGVRVADFASGEQAKPAPRMAQILAKGKPVIGYYGALAEWVDQSLIRGLADRHSEWEFVLIGKAWLDTSLLENVPNIHYLGPVPYNELSSYAVHFNVGIIPFVVNELTDCVSPIKLFEYSALGFPVVTTPFYEVTQYQAGFIHFARDVDEFSSEITVCLNKDIKDVAQSEGRGFAEENQWSNRLAELDTLLLRTWEGIKRYANFLPYRHLAVMTETFFHYDGQGFYAGGAERYLIDLAEIAARLNIQMIVYQYGMFPWMRKYRGIDVLSLASTSRFLQSLNRPTILKFNRNFYLANLARAALNIYSPFSDNWPSALHPSIGISHGISWDNFYANYTNGVRFWDSNRGSIEASRNCDLLVSVDTNTANWFQTIDFEVGQKIRYIPNYVDLERFHPIDREPSGMDKVVILYPRRLYRARGLYLLLAVMDDILAKYSQVEFHFVGRGFPEDTRHVELKQQMWGQRVQWYSLDPDDMPQAYQSADIVLIPTLYSEGTSLSCLEAMACGNAVIATRIGGLTDLIINNHNGLLIEPNEEGLKTAILDLLDHSEKLERLKKNGLEVAKAFSKRSWQEKWVNILHEQMPAEAFTDGPDKGCSRTRLIDFYCANIESNYLHRLLEKLLQNGLLVHLRVKEKDSDLIEKSFQRLQFVSWQEALETRPDLVISDEGITQEAYTAKAVDYCLTGDLEQDLAYILGQP